MIAHLAIRRVQLPGNGNWLYAHGWVLGSATGAGLATSRAEAIRKACIEAESAGAKVLLLAHARDWSSVPAPITGAGPELGTYDHHDVDLSALAVAQRAASVELMRECVRRCGVPDLLGDASAAVEQLGGPETVASLLGCDAAQVCRWASRGWPDHRLRALRRELEALQC